VAILLKKSKGKQDEVETNGIYYTHRQHQNRTLGSKHKMRKEPNTTHLIACPEKGVLDYTPEYDAKYGFEMACGGYFKNLK
jgi:hypothetical protein